MLGLAMFSWRLGQTPLAGTEGHRAITAHQIATEGHWLVPRLFGHTYLRKPPLHYWALAGFELAVGRANEWVWRLPSAIWAATLAAIVAGFSRRWFGPAAGWTGGLCQLALVALWSESRSADLDALNVLASVVAALCMIEMAFRRGRWRLGAWLASVALAAMLMTKGPAGAPVVLGAMLGASLAIGRWRWLARPAAWGPWLLGAAVFAAWVLAVWFHTSAADLQVDRRGIGEAQHNFLQVARMPQAVVAAIQVLAYTLPAPLALLLWSIMPVRFRAVAAALLVALGITIVNGVSNPRYLFMVLPLLAVLVGATAAAWRRGRLSERVRLRLRQVLTVTLAVAAVACVALVVAAGRVDAAGTAVCVAAAVSGAVGLRALLAQRAAPGAWATWICLALLMAPFAELRHRQRSERSGFVAGRIIASSTPDDAVLVAGAMVWDRPEVLYYSGRAVRSVGWSVEKPDDPDPSAWYVLTSAEWQQWGGEAPDWAGAVIALPHDHRNSYLVTTLPPSEERAGDAAGRADDVRLERVGRGIGAGR